MPYKRPNLDKPKKPHPIQDDFGVYDQIHTEHDQGWITPNLIELHEDGRFALHQFSKTVEDVKNRDLSDYKPEVAKAKKTEPVLAAKRALMTFLKKHISKAKSETEKMKNAILRVTEPETFSDPVKSMSALLRDQEIRSIIRNTDPKHRDDLIKGNVEFIKALVNSPDEIISKDHLTKIRRDYAFRQDPSLAEQEKDTTEIYKSIRKRAGDINATASKMLIYAKLDDPLPPTEHFEVFEPEDDYTKLLAEKRVQKYEKEQDKRARQKEFNDKETGVNLQIDERVRRKHRG